MAIPRHLPAEPSRDTYAKGEDKHESIFVAAASTANIVGQDKSFGINRQASQKQHQRNNKQRGQFSESSFHSVLPPLI